ncbi:hypothetical protein HOY80DRAFT_637454 [Tuber brumale]|nr:hypothetical protein HOY80DRAFT_637454 [Tuber brumale]
MSLANLPSECPPESSAQARVIEHDPVPSTPFPRTPTSIANSNSSTLSQSPSNISCFSTGTFNPNPRHTNHIMDPINVLSHPHESNPLLTGTPATSPADAAHKLQQLLKASAPDGVPEQSPELVDEVGSVHSTGSSLKYAKGIVSGLFRANKSLTTIPDKVSPSSEEPCHHLSGFGTLTEPSTNSTPVPGPSRRIFSPRGIFQKPNMTPPIAKAEATLPTEGSTDSSIAPDPAEGSVSSSDEEETFSVLSLVRRSREKKATVQALLHPVHPRRLL